MNEAAFMSALRSFLIALGGVGVTKGYITEDVLHAGVGLLLILAPAVWGYLEKINRDKPQ